MPTLSKTLHGKLSSDRIKIRANFCYLKIQANSNFQNLEQSVSLLLKVAVD